MSNRLTIKGQVTIPKAIREHLGLQEGGSSVEFVLNADGTVTVRKASAADAGEDLPQGATRARVQRTTRAAGGRVSGLQRARADRGVLALLAGGF